MELNGTTRNDARMPFSDCASFIDSESLELSDCFKKCAAFDEHAAAGHRRQAKTIDTGVEITNAHGQAITNITRLR
jgi:hypothetical protein